MKDLFLGDIHLKTRLYTHLRWISSVLHVELEVSDRGRKSLMWKRWVTQLDSVCLFAYKSTTFFACLVADHHWVTERGPDLWVRRLCSSIKVIVFHRILYKCLLAECCSIWASIKIMTHFSTIADELSNCVIMCYIIWRASTIKLQFQQNGMTLFEKHRIHDLQ